MRQHCHKWFLFLCTTLLCACTYRFTNAHIQIPDGGKTIAIAPIFDSSRIVIPHDIIWDSLQQAFASNGLLQVSSMSDADFFLQTHVKDAHTAEYESDSTNTVKDPHQFLDSNNKPLAPNAYVDLHAAEVYSKRENIGFTILVEVWNLKSKKLLLQKEYYLKTNFNMFTIPTPLESRYIRNEETNELVISQISKDFSKQVVSDLFSTESFQKKTH